MSFASSGIAHATGEATSAAAAVKGDDDDSARIAKKGSKDAKTSRKSKKGKLAKKKSKASKRKERASGKDEGGSDVWGYVEFANDWYPFMLDDDLEPEVEEKFWFLWITSMFCGEFCGSLWIPMLFVGEDPGEEYFVKEALILIALELLSHVIIAIVGAGTSGIGFILEPVLCFWLTPVGIINTYDRALKRERGHAVAGKKGGKKKRQQKKKGKKKKTSDRWPPGHPAPTLAQAY